MKAQSFSSGIGRRNILISVLCVLTVGVAIGGCASRGEREPEPTPVSSSPPTPTAAVTDLEIIDVENEPTGELPARPSSEPARRPSDELAELDARAAGVDTNQGKVDHEASMRSGDRPAPIISAQNGVRRTAEARSRVTTASAMQAHIASQARGQITAQAHGYIAPLPPTPWNTEQYDHSSETGFRDAVRRPLSTFSIDVDTASYSNVRRILNGGTLPTPGAVRIEELINYFDYDYPEPQDGHPFSVTTELASAPWNPRHRLLLVGLRGERLETDRVVPRNLVFLLDVSGSMNSPDKLPLVKSGLRKLARELRSEDHVSIVVYAGASGLVLEPTSGRDAEVIDRALDRLHAGGSTNGADGIRLAYQTARTHFDPHAINRVILATDGDFNVGTTSRDELVRLIESERESGVYLTVLGVGSGNLKDATMEQLADHGNGNYAYLDTAAEARKVLIEEAGSTLVTIAKDVKIQIEFNPAAVAAYRLIGYENRRLADRDFNDDTKDAGEIGAGHTVTALYEIVPVGEALPAAEIDPLRYGSRHPSERDGGRERAAVSKNDDDALANELATVKLRYKSANAGRAANSSELITATIGLAHRDIDDASSDLRFAASVAAFGMTLVDSEHRAEATLAMAGRLGRSALGADPHAYRAEFLRLVAIAEGLAPRARLE